MCALLLWLVVVPAFAQSLSIAVQQGPTTLDPHYEGSTPNINALAHLYDCLVEEEAPGRLMPGLATGWRAIDDTRWAFTLREGVRFHDGTPFTAEDVVFSVERIRRLAGAPNPFTPFVRSIVGIDVVDPQTIHIRTEAPNPFLPRDLAYVRIVSRKLHAEAETKDFTEGRAAIGTGPYRLLRFTPQGGLELARNDAWFGTRQSWEGVTLKEIPSSAARAAALVSGEVDVIERVAVADLAWMRKDARVALATTASGEALFLFPDSTREASPFVTDKSGQPLAANPFRDVRVRRALSLAIDRPALVERVMDGAAVPANQVNSPGSEGRAADLPPLALDLDLARRLMAEAGWAEGFGVTLHGTRGLYTNDAALLQALAQAFARIGIAAKVEALPQPVFITRANAFEFSLFMAAYNSTTAASTIRGLLMTRDPPRGFGTVNRMRYANPALDEIMKRALTTLDGTARGELLAAAQREVIRDMAVVPLLYSVHNWATRTGRARFQANALGRTRAMFVMP
ncbi:MAG: ABC transporter substrate-binding protein [Alphaproteobacteria bacterium]|nr:ABC transporter substrate-binding protein [Alphaproteobacteria bacterium]